MEIYNMEVMKDINNVELNEADNMTPNEGDK